jgi:3-polyprenyl-4-hydroxybenzoate decarboxylase
MVVNVGISGCSGKEGGWKVISTLQAKASWLQNSN